MKARSNLLYLKVLSEIRPKSGVSIIPDTWVENIGYWFGEQKTFKIVSHNYFVNCIGSAMRMRKTIG